MQSINCSATILFVLASCKITWEVAHLLKILWLSLACRFKVIWGKTKRVPVKHLVFPRNILNLKLTRASYNNSNCLRTLQIHHFVLTSSECSSSSKLRQRATRLKRVSNIRRAALAINQQLIKPPKVPLYTQIEQPLHKNAWRLMEVKSHPSRSLGDLGSVVEYMVGIRVNWAMPWWALKNSSKGALWAQ
jgi:hypothetical protein